MNTREQQRNVGQRFNAACIRTARSLEMFYEALIRLSERERLDKSKLKQLSEAGRRGNEAGRKAAK